MSTNAKRILTLAILLLCAFPAAGNAGITGTLSGKVLDKETGIPLPGAAILIEGTTVGAMADKNGAYEIYNLPAGGYDVTVRMIGYAPLTIKDVTINIDLTTDLNFELSAKVLALDAVVITERKWLIKGEITSSSYFISGEEISNVLPVDKYLDVVGLLPGVVGTHIRGGRETDILYTLDGLPVQSTFSRQLSSYLPNASISEMMVQTGGFAAEYGQANSGIVNVISKNGRNVVEGELRAYSDFAQTGLTTNDNTRRLEFNLGGPLLIGFGGPSIKAKYFMSGDLNLSDTAHREELRQAFDSPIFTNYNVNSKVSVDIARNTIIAFQALLSNWQWRQFDPQWQLNPSGLAENKHKNHRLSVSMTHTFSPRFFAAVRYGNYVTRRWVLGDIQNDPPLLLFQDPEDPNSLILSGNEPWNETLTEASHVAKLDLVGKATKSHLLKLGLEFQNINIKRDALKFEPLASTLSVDNRGIIQFRRRADNYRYEPHSYALYFQDEISHNDINANIGLRFDFLSPQIQVNEPGTKASSGFPMPRLHAKKTDTISPRLGVSLPLSNNERLHLNYGWYYQMPALYYLYENSDQSIDGELTVMGNTELKPQKTIATEFSYKRVIGDDVLFAFTGFVKRFENLIDSKISLFPDSVAASFDGALGYAQYVNTASAKTSGFEITLQKKITDAVSARVSYTYMNARGTGSSAEAHQTQNTFQIDDQSEFPLSWDQRHSFILNADWKFKAMRGNILYRLLSPQPVTTSTSLAPNDQRLSWKNLLDLKISFHDPRLLGDRVVPFIEVRNLLDDPSLIETLESRTGVAAYRLFDPTNSTTGRKLRIGMRLNF